MKHIINLTEIKDFTPFKGFKAKVVHSDTQTYAFWKIEKGSILPLHQHINEQVSMVTKGEFEMTIDGQTTVLKKGMLALIPPNTDHSGIAITDVEIMDVFTPIREDFPK